MENRIIKIPQMIAIPRGAFNMGSHRFRDAQPVRKVFISEYAISKYQITNREYRNYLLFRDEFIPDSIADRSKDKFPVANVSWYSAMDYCKWLNETTKDSKSDLEYNLPTEAEWEYAARGPQNFEFPWGNDYAGGMDIGGWGHSKLEGIYQVGLFPKGKSPFGVVDMVGNVYEWVKDYYAGGYISSSDSEIPDINPQGPPASLNGYRVARGGIWFNRNENYNHSARREQLDPDTLQDYLGFRIVARWKKAE